MLFETSRLIVSRLRMQDAASLFLCRSHPDVMRYQTWRPGSVEEVERFVDQQQQLAFDVPGTWFQLGIHERDAGLLVGDLGVHFLEPDARQVEFGVTVSPDEQGRGIASEAVTALFDHLFERSDRHRIEASVDPRNVASAALMRRLGMREEALHRESVWHDNAWADDQRFAVLRREWESRSL